MKRSQLERKPMKRSQPRRDWSAARAKIDQEGHNCRVCAATSGADWRGGPPEAAHIIGRRHDKARDCECGHPFDMHDRYGCRYESCQFNHVRRPSSTLWVDPIRIVPLCKKHHRAYDAHELDLLPYLTVEEQAQAVLDAGGIELARNRICGGRDG